MSNIAPYLVVQTETCQKTGPNFAYNTKPDALWECATCGAVVRDRERHDSWHAA